MGSIKELFISAVGSIRILISWLVSVAAIASLWLQQTSTVQAFASSRPTPLRPKEVASGRTGWSRKGYATLLNRLAPARVFKARNAVVLGYDDAKETSVVEMSMKSPFSSARRSVCAVCPRSSCDGCPLAGDHGQLGGGGGGGGGKGKLDLDW